jgi:hypothetical protein
MFSDQLNRISSTSKKSIYWQTTNFLRLFEAMCFTYQNGDRLGQAGALLVPLPAPVGNKSRGTVAHSTATATENKKTRVKLKLKTRVSASRSRQSPWNFLSD